MPDKNCKVCGGTGSFTTCLGSVYDCACLSPEDIAKGARERLAYYKAQLDKAERDMGYYTKKIRELARCNEAVQG